MTQIQWRWREYLVPKTFTYLYMGLPQAEAEAAARKAGEYSASRVYEVSLDGGETWHPAPADMPVIDIRGNPMPEDRRKTGKPSDAAKAEIDRRLALAEPVAPLSYPTPGAATVTRPAVPSSVQNRHSRTRGT